jgi:hypothetical protein
MSNCAGHSSAISFPVISPDIFFDYTLPDDDNYHDDDHPDHVNSDCKDDAGEDFGKPLFLDQDADEDQEYQQVLVDKYDIDQSHELKEDNTFLSSVDDVVHLELATICKDGNFPLRLLMKSFNGPNVHTCEVIAFQFMPPAMRHS